eukprot:594644-Prymnesium_polylepis.1
MATAEAPATSGAPSAAPILKASIVCTTNQIEDESFLPAKSLVTLFRIAVDYGDQNWSIYRRYSDFHELNDKLLQLGATLPELPPKLLLNQPEDIAERYLELDSYLRKVLAMPHIGRHSNLLEFLGAEKQGVRYGVRRYDYDSTQSEGNRYIRDNDL